MTKNKKLQRPHLRANLIASLQELAAREYQLKNWTSPTAAHRFSDSMDSSVEVLFDMMDLKDTPPEEWIDYVFYNAEEAEAMKPIIENFRELSSKIGYDQPDTAYINSPIWDEIIRTSKNAYETLMKNEPADSLYRQLGPLE